MSIELWFLALGGLLLATALASSMLKPLPLTPTILYLLFGLLIGPLGLGLLAIDPLANAHLLERVIEVAVLISLFTTGMKLRVRLGDPLWRLPLRLASVSMVVTVTLVALVGVLGLGLEPGAAVLLGAILAPTDPVLASGVQVEHPGDRDRLRFMLSGEAGLNDGTAFPFVMLGLGLMGLHDLGDFYGRWLLIDVLWAVVGGLGVGALCGWATGKAVLYLRREKHEGLSLDEFLTVGLIAVSYGAALLLHAYGFLAVFAAGFALRQLELGATRGRNPKDIVVVGARAEDKERLAADPVRAPQYLAGAVLTFNEQLERLLEIGLVILVAAMLTRAHLSFTALWFIPLLFLVIRPLSLLAGLPRGFANPSERILASWFGIRGIGSLYYMMYAVTHGVPEPVARAVLGLVLPVVVASIVLHGVSVTPLMAAYESRRRPRAAGGASAGG